MRRRSSRGHCRHWDHSAASYATIPDLVILPGVAIASRRPVRSILLVSKVPVNQIRSVALDTSSMTSVALTKVLFARLWKATPTFASMPPDLDAMLQVNDAALVIGYLALKVDRGRYLSWDLAEEWIRLTGKPFVFAFWAVREMAFGDCSSDLALTFQRSRDNGLLPEKHEADISGMGAKARACPRLNHELPDRKHSLPSRPGMP